MRYLDISDADMEKGGIRLEPNISLRPVGSNDLPDYKVEVKNINSFNFVKRAIDFEIERHTRILDEGKIPVQETRGWNEAKNSTVSQRVKEEADDYRYFPEPDIPPLRWTSTFVNGIKSQLPEFPDAKLARFKKEYELNDYDAALLIDTKPLADYFEECVKVSKTNLFKDYNTTPKLIANLLINKKPDINEVLPVDIIKIITSKNLSTIPTLEIEAVVKQIIQKNSKAVEDYKKGKEQSLMFLLGQVMKELKGKGNAQIVKSALIKLVS